MPAVPSSFVEPLWVQFVALLPEHHDTHRRDEWIVAGSFEALEEAFGRAARISQGTGRCDQLTDGNGIPLGCEIAGGNRTTRCRCVPPWSSCPGSGSSYRPG